MILIIAPFAYRHVVVVCTWINCTCISYPLVLFTKKSSVMEKNNETNDKSRRWFLSLFTAGSQKTPAAGTEMVKMLTADGKLVEVERSVLKAASKNQKAANKDIYEWMDNPSKENK